MMESIPTRPTPTPEWRTVEHEPRTFDDAEWKRLWMCEVEAGETTLGFWEWLIEAERTER